MPLFERELRQLDRAQARELERFLEDALDEEEGDTPPETCDDRDHRYCDEEET